MFERRRIVEDTIYEVDLKNPENNKDITPDPAISTLKDVPSGCIKIQSNKHPERGPNRINSAQEGKWVVRFEKGSPDLTLAWNEIKKEIEKGTLLYEAKVFVLKEEFSHQAIVVYSKDYQDKRDVKDTLLLLQKLEIREGKFMVSPDDDLEYIRNCDMRAPNNVFYSSKYVQTDAFYKYNEKSEAGLWQNIKNGFGLFSEKETTSISEKPIINYFYDLNNPGDSIDEISSMQSQSILSADGVSHISARNNKHIDPDTGKDTIDLTKQGKFVLKFASDNATIDRAFQTALGRIRSGDFYELKVFISAEKSSYRELIIYTEDHENLPNIEEVYNSIDKHGIGRLCNEIEYKIDYNSQMLYVDEDAIEEAIRAAHNIESKGSPLEFAVKRL